MKQNNNYTSYEFDNIYEGRKIKLEHNIYVDESDISDLISRPIAEIQAMRDDSVKTETAVFEKTQQMAREWEKQAAVTRQLDMAIEYLKISEVKHTFNKWVNTKNEYDYNEISNRVYKMRYRIYERSSWRTDSKMCDVTWSIFTNSPRSNHNVKVAGQEKTYKSKEEAEKYMLGRIKAYSHLFTEISPPIPKEYEKPFRVYGQLLPGYITEEMQTIQKEKNEPKLKSSVRKELKSLKSKEANVSKKSHKSHQVQYEIS